MEIVQNICRLIFPKKKTDITRGTIFISSLNVPCLSQRRAARRCRCRRLCCTPPLPAAAKLLVRLGRVGLGWVGLGRVGSGPVRLGWVCAIVNNTGLLTLLRGNWTIPLLLKVCNSINRVAHKGNKRKHIFAILSYCQGNEWKYIFAILFYCLEKLKNRSSEAPSNIS